MHQFLCKRKRYGVPDPDWDLDKIIDDGTIPIKDLGLSVKDKILYKYDFGDGWEHELLLEKSCQRKRECSPCVSKEPEPVLRRIAEDPRDMKIFWRSSKIRKMRNMRHGRRGFPRPSTQNILISTKSTVVCLRENGGCFLLFGRDGKNSMSVPLIQPGRSGKAFSKGLHPQHLTLSR